MIWLLSDLHGGQDFKGLDQYLSFCKKDDILLILGDLELHFRDTKENADFTTLFESLKCNIAFLDGNHENFDWLDSLPTEEWNGGIVHRVSDNIVHLMRGNIFNINGYRFFVMGGCKSSQKWKDSGLWYPQEDPNEQEITAGYENLKKCGNKVDFILTHKYRREESADPHTLEGLIDYIDENVSFRCWYAGHWHKNEVLDRKHITVFDEPLRLEASVK